MEEADCELRLDMFLSNVARTLSLMRLQGALTPVWKWYRVHKRDCSRSDSMSTWILPKYFDGALA